MRVHLIAHHSVVSVKENKSMSVSELEQIGYEEGMKDTYAYIINTIRKAIENPSLDIIPSKMALQVLLASLEADREESTV
jgi:hypothetical protein